MADATTGTSVELIPAAGSGLPGIRISDADPVDKDLTDNAVKMYRMGRDLLGDGQMGSKELRYLAASLVSSLGDVLDVMGVDHE